MLWHKLRIAQPSQDRPAGPGVHHAKPVFDMTRPGASAVSRRACISPLAKYSAARERERTSEMPKMKTKSGAKKRFKMTGTGKVKAAAQGKRHGMIKRHAKFIRQARGTMVLDDSDAKIVKKYMPYAR
jgi:large subunit ribosomal protein L35